MRTAICIVGQMRFFDHPCLSANFKKYIIDKLQPDIFVQTWSNIGHSQWLEFVGGDISRSNDTITEEQVRAVYNPVHCSVESFQTYLDTLSGEWRSAAVSPSAHRGGQDGSAIPFFYLMQRCVWAKKAREKEMGRQYDCVIVTRPDLIFYKPIPNYVFKDLGAFWHWWPYGRLPVESCLYPNLMISCAEHIDYCAEAYYFLEKYWPAGGPGGRYNACKSLYYQMYGRRTRSLFHSNYFTTFLGTETTLANIDQNSRDELARTIKEIRAGRDVSGPAVEYLVRNEFAVREEERVIWKR